MRISSSSSSWGALAGLLQFAARVGVVAVLVEQLLGHGRVVGGRPPLPGQLGRRLQLPVGTSDLCVALPVGDHLRVAHLLF